MSSLLVGLVSLVLLPLVPILPGLGSLLSLAFGLIAWRVEPGRRWLVLVAIVVSGGGLALAISQLVAALSAVLASGMGLHRVAVVSMQ
jgi:hypothetical protein